MKKIISFLTLFTSISTIVCCALPALFVTLGFGAVFAGLIGQFPQLIWLSENKYWLFGFGALMLVAGGFLQWRVRYEPCPIEKNAAEACSSARRWSLTIYSLSLGLYAVGGFFAFIAPKLF